MSAVDVDAPENATWIDRYLGIIEFAEPAMSHAIARAASGMSSPRYNSEFYKNPKDMSGSFRWAPFLALQSSNSFLTMLLLLSKYRIKSVPVVDLGVGNIENIITQPAVIHMLEECASLQWFESWGTKKLSELGLPLMTPNHVVKVLKISRLDGVKRLKVIVIAQEHEEQED
ncbi:hypothetical protein AgCh_021784 [Apium graveolens]